MSADTAPKIGPVLATFVVANNMIGSGFFLLPATLAKSGGVTALALAAVHGAGDDARRRLRAPY
ncbi:hypothetical protein H1235_07085 [Pseudoxanthomonas sp. NC8]|nr:hypothetical protein H1235_07085 [Pseudoxanthomonas sp. NC8]